MRSHFQILVVMFAAATAAAQDPGASPSPTSVDAATVPFKKLLDATSEGVLKGDPVAQYVLGTLLEENGLHADASEWYRKAAEQGSGLAQGSLGQLLLQGRGLPQDFSEAAKWSIAAANQGDPLGMLNLALMHGLGHGYAIDRKEASKWALRAAELDCSKAGRLPAICAEAQALVAAAYLDGKGILQDYVQAHMWANLASAALPEHARKDAVDLRDAAARQMTPEQIGQAQTLAREWKPKQSN